MAAELFGSGWYAISSQSRFLQGSCLEPFVRDFTFGMSLKSFSLWNAKGEPFQETSLHGTHIGITERPTDFVTKCIPLAVFSTQTSTYLSHVQRNMLGAKGSLTAAERAFQGAGNELTMRIAGGFLNSGW